MYWDSIFKKKDTKGKSKEFELFVNDKQLEGSRLLYFNYFQSGIYGGIGHL